MQGEINSALNHVSALQILAVYLIPEFDQSLKLESEDLQCTYNCSWWMVIQQLESGLSFFHEHLQAQLYTAVEFSLILCVLGFSVVPFWCTVDFVLHHQSWWKWNMHGMAQNSVYETLCQWVLQTVLPVVYRNTYGYKRKRK